MSTQMILESVGREGDGRLAAVGGSPDATRVVPEVVIEARPGWRPVDLAELSRHRDLLWYMTWRGIRVRYAQSALGIGWALVQPLAQMLVFAFIFGRLAGLQSDGVSYALFAICGLVPWTFFSTALSGTATSLVDNAQVINKIYFPRLILPLSAIGSKTLDLLIGLGLLALMLAWYGVAPPASALVWCPLLLGLLVLTIAGLGLWLSAMAIQYRDVAYALPFCVQMLMYLSPVVYSVSLVPERLRPVLALNPLMGIIGGFRAAVLGQPLPWDLIGIGAVVAVTLAVTGAFYFRKMERLFADVA